MRSLGLLERANAESVEEFVAEHYWSYNSQPNGSTPECDVERLYGGEFARSLSRVPITEFWAERSAVTLHRGVLIQ